MEMDAWGLKGQVPGIRHEWIDQSLEDRLSGEEKSNGTQVLLLASGPNYQLTGFVRPPRWSPSGIQPHRAWARGHGPVGAKCELRSGFSVQSGSIRLHPEAIGFLNHYTNMLAQCSLSVGCAVEDLDKEYTSGEVDVYGLETLAAHRVDIPAGCLSLFALPTPGRTRCSRVGSFREIPNWERWKRETNFPIYPPIRHPVMWELPDSPGEWISELRTFLPCGKKRGAAREDPKTDAIFHLDASGRYSPTDWMELYLKGGKT